MISNIPFQNSGVGQKPGTTARSRQISSDGQADGAAASLTLEVLQCGHEVFGVVVAGGAATGAARLCGLARGVCW